MDNDYIFRINQAINYIHKNLDKNLTVEDIANHCCFSKFYFNRIFKSVVNESIYSFIKRLKLENSAFKLRTLKNKSITDIALEAGYSPSNFAFAFKDYFGVSASDYRKTNDIPLKDSYLHVADHIRSMKKTDDFFNQINSKIKIRALDKMLLMYERFIGNYYDLTYAWENYCKSLKGNQLVNDKTTFVGISYDDPLITDEDHCMYDMCITVDKISSTNIHIIDEGKYACYQFCDLQENLSKAYNEIFALWMPFAKYKFSNTLPIEIYHSGLDNEGKLHLDICMPII